MLAAMRRASSRVTTLALLCLLLWSGARCTRVEDLARQRLSLSQRDAAEHERPSPGPVGACSDAELADHIRRQIDASRLHGEGYRKLWARLRFAGAAFLAPRVALFPWLISFMEPADDQRCKMASAGKSGECVAG